MHAMRVMVAAGLMLLAAVESAEAAKWSRVRSAHFVFVGDASERDLRRTAERLEQFRDVMTRALPRAASQSPVPTVVMVFRNDESLAPYKPLFQGRPIELAGYFQAGQDVNYIVVNADLGDAAFETVFHEYSHFLAGNTLGVLPVWLNEGLAQVYQTFETRSGGKSAFIGIATADYIRLLRGSTLMPLQELLAVDWLSPVYNEGDRRTVFYAESWALVHYLMFADPLRKAQFNQYIGLLTRNVAPEAAFTQAFGPDPGGLERELRTYIGKYQFPAVRFDFDTGIPLGASGPGEAIDEVEAGAYLGDLLARTRRVDEARVQLTALRVANPQSARTALSLGLLELREGRADVAMPLIEQAASLMPGDEGAQLALGESLLERLRALERGSDVADDTILRARRALARSLELSPNLAHTLATFGQLELLIGDDLTKAVSYLDRAARLVPSRESYRLLLATGLIRQRDYERAQSILRPLLETGSRVEIRESSRRLLRNINDRIEAERAELAEARAEAAAASAPSAVAGNPAAAASSASAASAWQLSSPPLRANQSRVVGLFTGVECLRGAVVFTVQAESKPYKLRAASIGAVDLVTYRTDAPSSVDCGPVARPLLVQATYQMTPAAGIDGQALTIEILPEGYPVR